MSMLRFQAKWIEPILGGLKTQTLRRSVPGTVMCAERVHAGSDYRHPPFALLAVTGIDLTPRAALDEGDARREGLGSLPELLETLDRLYPGTATFVRVRFTVVGVGA